MCSVSVYFKLLLSFVDAAAIKSGILFSRVTNAVLVIVAFFLYRLVAAVNSRQLKHNMLVIVAICSIHSTGQCLPEGCEIECTELTA
jgi:hypothetical protein